MFLFGRSISAFSMAFCTMMTSCFADDEILLGAQQRLGQNGSTFDIASPAMGSNSNKFVVDICQLCGCCTQGEAKIDLYDLKQPRIAGALEGNFVMVPKSDLAGIVEAYAKRSSEHQFAMPQFTKSDRSDLCQKWNICDDKMSLQMSKLPNLSEQEITQLQDSISIVPVQEFNLYLDKAYK
jgi:hypothetical protein